MLVTKADNENDKIWQKLIKTNETRKKNETANQNER